MIEDSDLLLNLQLYPVDMFGSKSECSSFILSFVIPLICAYFDVGSASVTQRLKLGDLNPEVYVLSSVSLENDVRLWPSVGNGHIATVVHTSDILMNGLYNGRTSQSHRAAIPSPLRVNVTSSSSETAFNRTYRLDTRIGTYEELLVAVDCSVVLCWYAHRRLHALLVFEIEINRSSTYNNFQDDLNIFLNVTQFGASKDIVFTERPIKFINVSYMFGKTLHPETTWSGNQSVHVIFDKIPQVLTLPGGQEWHSWTFLASVHSKRRVAVKAYVAGSQAKVSGDLNKWHVRSWLDLWQHGRIDIESNLTIARALAGSFYGLFISLPEREDLLQAFIGLSPCGLSWGDEESYFGHIFWDQETWMYPPLLLLHSDIGHMLLKTRVRMMASAALNANQSGYHGLRFPWESALTGVETSESMTCAQQEVHISGDIVFAIMQYLWASGNANMFIKEAFGTIVIGIGDFWISRSRYNSSRQLYDITGVMPPDEYAENVSNSVYTNMVAIRSLESAAWVAMYLGFLNHTIYDYYARHVFMPFDKKLLFHHEYEGYVTGTTVKQADVVLLGFPFMWPMPSSVRLKDLEVYEKVTSAEGPAMSDSMYAIGWLEQKQFDKAITSFNQMFEHIAGDFQIWTESKHGKGATNFITGMGGFLQSILFGFAGLRLRSQQMDIDPVLPPGCTKMTITGLDYKGTSLDITVTKYEMVVMVTSVKPEAGELWLCYGQVKQRLYLREPVTLKRGKAILEVLVERVRLNRMFAYRNQYSSMRRFYKKALTDQ